jgi:enoyl-CoA hydratase/carnithine racemase
MLDTIDHGAVRELRMDRPPANALDPGLVAALRAAVERAPGAGARALVLSAAPGKLFSGGLDLPALLGLGREEMAAFLGDFLALLRALATSPLPTVAAITGHAPAGGAVLAIQCDHRVMADGEVRIGLNEVAVGIPLPRILHTVLARVVGARQAERLGVRGLVVPAGEALRIGLVDELAPADAVVERACEVARDFVALPPEAMRRTRALARAELAAIYEREERSTWEAFVDDWFAPEAQATLRAVVERLKKKG